MRKLYAKQKIFKMTDHYPITDEQGQMVYHVDQPFKLFQFQIDVTYPDGEHCMHIQKEMFTWLPRYQCTFADGRSVTVASQWRLAGDHMTIDSTDFNLSVDRNFASFTTTICLDGEVIGTIKWQMKIADTFELTVEDENYQELIVAIFIMIDHLADSRSKRR